MLTSVSSNSTSRKLYVITPTGDRKEAFSLCIDYVNRQTIKPDMWLIVDDGKSESVYSQVGRIQVPYDVLRLAPVDTNSVIRNIRMALHEIPEDAYVCIMEDDDWYPPRYLEEMVRLLDVHEVVASRNSHYYNIRTRQYHIKNNKTNLPMHGNGFARTGLSSFRSFISSTSSSYADTMFSESWKGDRGFNDDHRVIHITGFGDGRPGTTSSHSIKTGETGWKQDPDGSVLASWIGDDSFRYLNAVKPNKEGKIYVFSNVQYPESEKIKPNPEDLLVFLNFAKSLSYYNDHANKVVYHRARKKEYGEETPGVEHFYVYDGGDLGIPSRTIKKINDAYDWAYTVGKGDIKSPTTGYLVVRHLVEKYPGREIVLVNFGYSVAKSTFRCTYHNWVYEARELDRFRHIFTADTKNVSLDSIGDLRVRGAFESSISTIFTEEGSDRMRRHSYGELYAQQLSPLVGIHARIVEICVSGDSGLRALHRILPDADIIGIQANPNTLTVPGVRIVSGDVLSAGTWSDIPGDVDVIIDDGTHRVEDITRTIPAALSKLKNGGVLLIEDIANERDVSAILGLLPHAVCCRTLQTSEYDDDRVIVYRHAVLL